MTTHPYLWFALSLLAIVGMTLAMHQEMKPTASPACTKWCKWIVVFAILAMFDTLMLAQPWNR